MNIFYRISNNSYNKVKLQHATKQHCLLNFISEFNVDDNYIHIIADNVTDTELLEFLTQLNNDYPNIDIEHTSLSNAQSFKYVFNKSLSLQDDEQVYFVEDDYLHLPGAYTCINEALSISDYVTLYDHPDKYNNHSEGGDNPFIEYGGEVTRVVMTKSSHWKLTNSTTMTFASKVSILKQDVDIWMKHLTTDHPNDFIAFLDLRESGRTLLSSIPGLSTHCEIKYLSPLTDWETI